MARKTESVQDHPLTLCKWTFWDEQNSIHKGIALYFTIPVSSTHPHPTTLFPTLEGPNKLHWPHPPCCIEQRPSKGTALYSTIPISSTHLHPSPVPPPRFPQQMKAQNQLYWLHPPCCIELRSSKGTALYSTIPISSTHLYHPPPHFPQHMKAKNKWHWPHPPYCIAQRSSEGTALYSTIPISSTPLPCPPHPTKPNIWRPPKINTDHIHHAASSNDQAKGQHSTPLSRSPPPTSTVPPPHFPQQMKAKNKLHWPHPPYCAVQRLSCSQRSAGTWCWAPDPASKPVAAPTSCSKSSCQPRTSVCPWSPC